MQNIEIDKVLYDLFNRFELEDISYLNRVSRHIEHSELLMTIKTFTDEQEEKIKRMIEVWENGDIPAADTKNILKSIKNVEDGVEAYYKIVEQVDEKYFEGRKQQKLKQDGEKQVILSCYMKEA